MMEKNILRSLRYTVKMIVLLALVFTAMILTNTSRVGGEALFAELFMSNKGMLLLAILLAMVILYPKMGFTSKEINLDIVADRASLISGLAELDFVLEGESRGVMTFRKKTLVKRILCEFNDAITVSPDGGYAIIEGSRKDVVRIGTKFWKATQE